MHHDRHSPGKFPGRVCTGRRRRASHPLNRRSIAMPAKASRKSRSLAPAQTLHYDRRLASEARNLIDLFRVACRAVTAAKNGPTIYQLCDPLLRGPGGGDQHLRQLYKIAIRNPPLTALLARAGVPQLRDETRRQALQQAIIAARDEASPDWHAVGRPLAALL